MEHTFLYDLMQGLTILFLLYDVYKLKKAVKRLESRRENADEKGKDDFWRRYRETTPDKK